MNPISLLQNYIKHYVRSNGSCLALLSFSTSHVMCHLSSSCSHSSGGFMRLRVCTIGYACRYVAQNTVICWDSTVSVFQSPKCWHSTYKPCPPLLCCLTLHNLWPVSTLIFKNLPFSTEAVSRGCCLPTCICSSSWGQLCCAARDEDEKNLTSSNQTAAKVSMPAWPQHQIPFDSRFCANSCLLTYHMSCCGRFNLNSCITAWAHTFFTWVSPVAANPLQLHSAPNIHLSLQDTIIGIFVEMSRLVLH